MAQNKEHMSDLVEEPWRNEGLIFIDQHLKSSCQVKFKDNKDGRGVLKSDNKKRHGQIKRQKAGEDERRQG